MRAVTTLVETEIFLSEVESVLSEGNFPFAEALEFLRGEKE
jgi:hypothetical protein